MKRKLITLRPLKWLWRFASVDENDFDYKLFLKFCLSVIFITEFGPNFFYHVILTISDFVLVRCPFFSIKRTNLYVSYLSYNKLHLYHLVPNNNFAHTLS